MSNTNVVALRDAVLMMLGGMMMWSFFWSVHKSEPRKRRSKGWHLITVPSWLSLICGHPLPDRKLEVALMVGQIGSLLFGFLWLPMTWLKLDHSQRVFIWSCVGTATFVTSFAVRITVMLINR